MSYLLITVLIYLISVTILHIIAYIYWFYKDSKGSTLADMYNYICEKVEISFIVAWIPFVNTLLIVVSIIAIIFYKILDILSFIFIKIKNILLNFMGKLGNIKIK